MNRRTFLSKTAAATVGLAALPARAYARRSPNETVNVAIIGLRGLNTGHPPGPSAAAGSITRASRRHQERPNHDVVDIDERHFGTSLPYAKDKWGDPKTETDFRRARQPRRRCGDDRGARPLARADDHPGLPGRQGCLRRETHQPQHRRRPADDRGGAPEQSGRAGGHAGTQRSAAGQSCPVRARWRTWHHPHGQDRDQSAPGSDWRCGGLRGAARRALRLVDGTGAGAPVQRAPLSLLLALVLGLRHGRSREHRRAHAGRDALAAWQTGASSNGVLQWRHAKTVRRPISRRRTRNPPRISTRTGRSGTATCGTG